MQYFIDKTKTFFYVIRRSLFDYEYLMSTLDASFGFSMKYLLSLIFVSSLILNIPTVIEANKGLGNIFEVVEYELLGVFEDGLEIKVNNGEMLINQEEPYTIPIKTESIEMQESGIDNLVVFDSEGTIDDVWEYRTLMLVNDKNIIVRKEEGRIESIQISDLENVVIDRSTATSIISEIAKILPWLRVMMAIVIFATIFLVLSIFSAIAIIFGSITALGVGLLLKKNLSFGEHVKLSMHSITFSFVLACIGLLLQINAFIPITFLGVFFVNTFVVQRYKRN